jgi:hypothetical protein
VAGARCVLDDLLVIPVADAHALVAEVQEHVCPQPPAAAPAGARRRGRRR